jgi:hypothetical protein
VSKGVVAGVAVAAGLKIVFFFCLTFLTMDGVQKPSNSTECVWKVLLHVLVVIGEGDTLPWAECSQFVLC